MTPVAQKQAHEAGAEDVRDALEKTICACVASSTSSATRVIRA